MKKDSEISAEWIGECEKCRWLAKRGVEVWRGGDEVVDGMGFSEEVGEVMGTGAPDHDEVAHSDTISEPMVAHCDGFGTTKFAGLLGYFAGD